MNYNAKVGFNFSGCHEMSYFKAKMHQIRLRGAPDAAGGAYSTPQTYYSWILGPTSKQRGRGGRTGGKGEGT